MLDPRKIIASVREKRAHLSRKWIEAPAGDDGGQKPTTLLSQPVTLTYIPSPSMPASKSKPRLSNQLITLLTILLFLAFTVILYVILPPPGTTTFPTLFILAKL